MWNLDAFRGCMRLVETSLLDTYPDDDKRMPYHDETKRTIIMKMVHEYSFVQLIIMNLVQYEEKAQKSLANLLSNSPANSGPSNVNALVLDGVYSHLDQIQARLDFLRYFIVGSRGGVMLSTQEIDILWENLIMNSLTNEEREVSTN